MAHIYTGNNISFQHNGKFLQAGRSHASFSTIVSLALAGDYTGAARLLNLKTVVTDAIRGSDMVLQGNSVLFKGKAVPAILGQRVLDLVKAGHTVLPLQKFLSNLWENPSYRASNELYDFLEAANLPITEDGHFLAYKSVRDDFTDHHTGKMDNSVGTIVEMPRQGVDEDKDRTCSAGLHFAAYNYAKGFGSSGRMVVLKINPRDVVAIPSDYNNEKGRACRYEILEEIQRSDDKLSGEAFVDTVKTPKELPKDNKWSVGDRVKIAASSIYANYSSSSNPENTSGAIESIDSTVLPIVVKWDNGSRNSYDVEDLEAGGFTSIYKGLTEGRTYLVTKNGGGFFFGEETFVDRRLTLKSKEEGIWSERTTAQWAPASLKFPNTGYNLVIKELDGEEVIVTPEAYVAPMNNYGDPDIWDVWHDYVSENASDFPINRKSTYGLSRNSTRKEYDDYFFTNYDVKNDNLIFRKHNGVDWDYITVKDLSDWYIEWTNINVD